MSKAKAAAKPTAAPAKPTAAPATPVVALRGGLAVAAVAVTGKPYRTAAAHNRDWWAAIGKVVATGKGTATVVDLLAAKVPSHFIGYCVRRGYLSAAK